MGKLTRYFVIVLFVLWSFLALTELSTKPDGQSPSILSQMWVNYGVAYAIFFGILYWFLHASGLSELRAHIERSKNHMEFVEQEINRKQKIEESDVD